MPVSIGRPSSQTLTALTESEIMCLTEATGILPLRELSVDEVRLISASIRSIRRMNRVSRITVHFRRYFPKITLSPSTLNSTFLFKERAVQDGSIEILKTTLLQK
jgi:hypothetical protein